MKNTLQVMPFSKLELTASTPDKKRYEIVLDADIKHGQRGHCLLNSLLGVKKMEFPYMGISGTPHPSDRGLQ